MTAVVRIKNLPIAQPTHSLLHGLRVMDEGALEVLLVVENERLVGLLTDGDARRALLRGVELRDPLGMAMHRQFTAVGPELGRAEVLDLMKARRIKSIPVVDGHGVPLGLHLLHDVIRPVLRPNPCLILCGGLGSRLRPITETIPKPMIPVAGRPILERLVLHLVGLGFREVFLAIHYLGRQIEDHFGDGGRFGCRIQYIRETMPLGTGGALGMMPGGDIHPVVVLNGDLVTQFDVGKMLDYHLERGNMATIGVRSYSHQVPFGTLETQDQQVVGLKEKPMLQCLINAGIYVVDSTLRDRVPPGVPVTMPGILEGCLVRGEVVGMMHIDDDWVDVGRHEELNRARGLG